MRTRLLGFLCYVFVTTGASAANYSITLSPGFNLIAGQLDYPGAGGNTVANVLPVVPDGTTLYKWDCLLQGYGAINEYTAGSGWSDPAQTLGPGEGAFIRNPLPTDYVLTFSGNPHVPVLPVSLTCGCGKIYMFSRQTNDTGLYENITGYPPQEGAVVYRFSASTQNYLVSSFTSGAWDTTPVLNAGEAALILVPGPCPTNQCLTIQCPTNIVISSCNRVPVTYAATVTDICATNYTVTYFPHSGSLFTPGTTTTVQCVATDGLGVTASCDFTVTVVCLSNSCLSIQCPSNLVLMSCTNLPVTYAATVTDHCTSNYNVTYNPPSGGGFDPGTTNTVIVTVTDSLGNAAGCSFTVTVLPCTCLPPPGSMSAWWPFDESATPIARDLAGTVKNSGTYQGNPTPTAGVVSNALCFDGANDYVLVPDDPEVNFIGSCPNAAESFTIDVWLRADPGGAGGVQALLDKRTNPNAPQGYALFLYNGVPAMQLADGNAYQNYFSTAPDLRDGQWHLLAVTVARCGPNGNAGTFYLDGAAAGTFLNPLTGDLNNPADLQIGRPEPDFMAAFAGSYFHGCLDELEIYKRALLPQEIQALFGAGTAGKCKPCATSPTALVLNCAGDKTVDCGTAWSFDPPTVMACCSNVTLSVQGTVTNGVCPQVVTQTWIATDDCGNTNTCSQSVTVVDAAAMPALDQSLVPTTPPTLSAGIATNDPRAQTFTVGVAGILSRVDVRIYRQRPVAISGDLTFELRGTIPGGAPTPSGTPALATVVLPKASIPDTLSWVSIPLCSYAIQVNPGDVLAIVLISETNGPEGPNTDYSWHGMGNNLYPAGSEYSKVYSGGLVNWTQNAGLDLGFRTYVSPPPPALNCAGDKTVTYGDVWDFDPPTLAGPAGCNPVPITVLSTVTNLPGPCQMTITRTWLAAACCGNSTCSQTVTVQCLTSPCVQIYCPSNLFLTGCSNATRVFGSTNGPAATVVDTCTGNYSVTYTPPDTSAFSPGSTNTVVAVVTDDLGNTASCAFQVIVSGSGQAGFNCVANKTIQCGNGLVFDTPTAFDPCCGGDVPVVILSTVTNSGPCPLVVTRTWGMQDQCHSNTNTCSQTVTVVNTNPPIFYCPNNSPVPANLVPNPGFETYTSCPTGVSQLSLAFPWFQPTLGTPDFFNVCAPVSTEASVPDNHSGSQAPHSGLGYGGGTMYGGGTTSSSFGGREYLETPLLTPLLPSHPYQVTFWVSLADNDRFGMDSVGAYFSSSQLVNNSTFGTLPVTPQVQNPSGNYLTSTTDWMPIQGLFAAVGGESYLTIGNFHTDLESGSVVVGGFIGYSFGSYYYVDDVSVTDLSCPTNKTVPCGSAVVFDAPSAIDACTGTNIPVAVLNTVTNTGPGQTHYIRTWTATNACGGSGTWSQTVTMLCPSNSCITVHCPSNLVFTSCTNIPVSYAATVTDTCTTNFTVTYNPPSGSHFMPGTTNTVVCTVTDVLGNQAACDFKVTVTGPVISITRIGLFYKISWTGGGKLQRASQPKGPWTDVPGGTVSPFIVLPNRAPGRYFYRVICF